jgi:hypothetical protein
MKKTNLAALIAASLIAPSGCVNDAVSPTEARLGRYTLRTINGDLVPALVFENNSARLEFEGGALRLNRDNSFTDSTEVFVTFKTGEVRRTTDVAAGIYRFAGDTVYFDSTRGEHYFMVFQIAGSLTQELAGARLVYRK